MSKFFDLLNEPLPSMQEKLANFVYESEENEGYSADEVSIIGYYSDSDFLEDISEETLGEMNFGGKIKTAIVELRIREGWEKPHVHVTNGKFNIAIRLDVPEYFIHPHAKNTFTNNKQKKKFDEFMRSKTYSGDESYWEYCIRVFNNHFGPKGHPITVKEQPDYTKLP